MFKNPNTFVLVGLALSLFGAVVQDAFKHNRARKNVILGGGIILICITILSCVSSFMIYWDGFADFNYYAQFVLTLFAVIVVEGAFIWLVYGFTRAFSSGIERLICMCGMSFYVIVMFINMVTHFMMVKRIPLQPFQEAWISWGAISVFIITLAIVLFITLADPVIRLIRLELRYLGLQQEKILEAKTDSLESERILEAMAGRAEWEADQLANKIMGEANQRRIRPSYRPGFVDAKDNSDPKA
jgi:MFS family permease